MTIPQDFYTSWGFGVDDDNFYDGSFVGPDVNGAEGLINESSDLSSGLGSLSVTAQSSIFNVGDVANSVVYFTSDLTLNSGWGFSDDNENFFDGNFSHTTTISANGLIVERSDTLIANGSVFVNSTCDTDESNDLALGVSAVYVEAQGNATESSDLLAGTDAPPDGLNINSLAESFNEILYSQYSEPRETPEIVAQRFTNAYVNYASRGVVPGVNIQAGGNEAFLLSAFSSDNTTATITEIANGITNFWKSANTPGLPAHGGTAVISVELIMDANALEAEIINNINVPTHSDGWLPMHTAIEGVLKSSVFVVTELVAGVEVPFNETIS